MSLHHLHSPDSVLREAHAALADGGVMAIVEFDDTLSFLAEGTAAARDEEEARRALRAMQSHAVPQLGSKWAQRFAAAGFTVEGEHEIAIDVRALMPAGAGRYAALWLRRLASAAVATEASGPRRLVDEGADLPTHLLHIRGTRTLILARRRGLR